MLIHLNLSFVHDNRYGSSLLRRSCLFSYLGSSMCAFLRVCCRGCRVKGTFFHCWWECKLVQPIWKSVWCFLRKLGINLPQKLGINLPQDPAIPLLGIYPTDAKSYHKDICSVMFIAALFVIVRTWKQPKCPLTGEWLKKMWYIYTKENYLAAKKRKKVKYIKKFSSEWMEKKPIMSEVTQTQEDKHGKYSLISGY